MVLVSYKYARVILSLQNAHQNGTYQSLHVSKSLREDHSSTMVFVTRINGSKLNTVSYVTNGPEFVYNLNAIRKSYCICSKILRCMTSLISNYFPNNSWMNSCACSTNYLKREYTKFRENRIQFYYCWPVGLDIELNCIG
jgi:hypothetical protein